MLLSPLVRLKSRLKQTAQRPKITVSIKITDPKEIH